MRNTKSILCCIFIVLIAFPFLGWYAYQGSAADNVLKSENRKVTPYREFSSLKKGEVRRYFKNLSLYISDRLFLKDPIVDFVTNYLKNQNYFLEIDLGKGLIGEDGFVFLGNDYEGVLNRHFSEGYEIKKINFSKLLSDQERIEKSASKIGAEYVVFVAPDKHAIYCEWVPQWLRGEGCNKVFEVTKKISSFLSDQGINVVYPYASLRNHKGEGLYYKTDTHWNKLGAKYGFDCLLSELHSNNEKQLINKDKTQELLRRQYNSKVGDLGKIVGLGKDFVVNDIDYELLYDGIVEWSEKGEGYSQTLLKNVLVKGYEKSWFGSVKNQLAPNDKKVLVICDSFMTAMSYFFNINFTQVYYVSRHFSVEELCNYVEDIKPDIVVYEMVERAFR